MTTDNTPDAPDREATPVPEPTLEGMPEAIDVPPPAYEPFAAGLVPCAVVIDTRNMHGQARKAFGRGLRPHVPGVRKALRRYGFEAVEIYAGVANKTMATSPSDMVRAAMEDNRQYAVELAHHDAVVLSGHLADRNGEMEEKQVDVLLALKVADLADRARQLGAPFECTVVLSEDMDLIPSYEFAHQRGVQVYAAAFDTIHTRDDQIKWLLLDERSLRDICPPPANLSLGAPMRELIARMATTPAPVDAPYWKVETWDNSRQQIVLSNSKGVTGILHERLRNSSIRRLSLYATGIEMEPRSKRFPLLTLGRARPDGDAFDGVETATVLYWVAPTRVKVKLDDSDDTATVSASPGHLLAGQRVAVLRTTRDGRLATYYIGPLGAAPASEGWPLPDATAIVTITASTPKGGLWQCEIDGLGATVYVPREHLKHARVGDRLRVALAGATPSGDPLAQPLTCCVPAVREKTDKRPPTT